VKDLQKGSLCFFEKILRLRTQNDNKKVKSFTTEGIIIKRRNFGEADRFLTVLTKRHGKISVKAVGVRRIISRRSAHVELLNHATLTLHKGKAVPILTEAVTLSSFPAIKEDLTKIGFAYHLCELIDGLCPENQELSDVFDLFCSALGQLEKEEEIAPVIYDFEIQLLTSLGFYPRDKNLGMDTTQLIEDILERRLRTRSLLSHFR
jgi:DNA repair protein RecO (recombination protein O)